MTFRYFTAPWCVPCRTFGPIMEQFAATHPNLVFEKIDVDATPEASAKYEVMSIPTVIAFKGDVEAARFSGARSFQYVEDFLASVS